MAGKRNYGDGCASAHALDLVGERWALLVVRELMLGAKRFSDLRASLPGISPNVLAQRLEQLEASAVIRHRRLPPPASASVYELTPWGLELEPAIQALGRWGARSPALPRGVPMSVDAVVLSLRTMFSPEAAGDLSGTVALELGDDRFLATFRAGAMDLARDHSTRADAVIRAEPAALLAVIYGGRKLGPALRAKELAVAGDKALAARFVQLFPLPEPAPAA